jgi:peptidoglycan/xylan/chitin deacetylase (PgdA/CDA1 family)
VIGARSLELLDSEGLHQLAAHGIEVGCHSRNHRAMPALDDASLIDETMGAAEDMERAALPKPRAFAYPYGERDARCERAVAAAGFAIAFGLRRGRATRRSDPFDIPRVEILARDRGWRFHLKTTFPRLAGLIR